MKPDQMIRLLSDFGKIPEHQVRFIWNMAYDEGWLDCKAEQGAIKAEYDKTAETHEDNDAKG